MLLVKASTDLVVTIAALSVAGIVVLVSGLQHAADVAEWVGRVVEATSARAC